MDEVVLGEPRVEVGPVTQVNKPPPAPVVVTPKLQAVAQPKPKTRVCEEYAMDKSAEEKVTICQWQ